MKCAWLYVCVCVCVTIKEIHTHLQARETPGEERTSIARRKTFSWTSGEWDVMRNSSPDTIDDDDEVNVSFPALSFRVLLARGKLLTVVWLGCQR